MNRLSAATAACGMAVAALLAGCSHDTPQAHLAAARQYLAKNDPRSAVIELKNALQLDPAIGDARLLLGRLLLERGEFGTAAIELRKARDARVADDAVVPLLAQALLRQGEAAALTQQFGAVTLTAPAAVADFETTLAIAYALQGRHEGEADAALAAAFRAVPHHVPALVVTARRQLAQGHPDAAFATVAQALAKAPGDPDVLVLQGDLLWTAKADGAGAIAAYRKAIAVRRDSLPAHAGALTVQLATDDLAGARTELAALRGVAPDHPATRLFAARLAFQEGQLAVAAETTQQLLKAAPDNVPALQLAGAIALRQGATAQAEQTLKQALQIAPDDDAARRLLVQALLQSDQPQAAVSTALPLIDPGRAPYPANLTVAALAALQNGNPAQAQELFGRAHAMAPDRGRAAWAASRLIGGRVDDAAVGELEAIAGSDQGAGADLALIASHLQRGETERALEAIARLEAKQPGRPLAPQLRGRLLLARGDVAAARKAFEAALAADPTYLPAAEQLAALDVQDGKAEAAMQRYERILAQRPNDVRSLLAMARARAAVGQTGEAVAGLIERAVRADPRAAAPHVALIDHYLAGRDAKAALQSADTAAAALPDNPDILDAQGRALLAAGDVNRAVSAYAGLVALRPRAPQALVGLANAQMAAKNPDAALQSLKQALAIAPDFAPAQQLTIAIDQSTGRYADAIALAHSVQKRQPGAAIGYVYEGDIEALQKHWPAAAAAYRVASTKPDSGGVAQRLHMALAADGKRAQADAYAGTWLAQHPKDATFALYLGNLALAEHDYAAARERYAKAVEADPSNADAHNNLAWTLGQLGLAGAIEHAQKANQLRPHNAAILDTWAGLLANQNRWAEAIVFEREAVTLEPQVRSRRLALARFYAKAGERTLARQELQVVLQAGAATAEYREAEGMLKLL